MRRKPGKPTRAGQARPRAEHWFHKALEARAAGRAVEAERACQRVVDLQPVRAEALHLLGLIKAERGNLSGAATCLERAARLAPADAACWNNLGNVLREAKRIEEAVAAYRAALSSAPSHLNAVYNLAVSLHDLGSLTEAVACYRRALALGPRDAEIWLGLGVALFEMSEPEDAETALRKALEHDGRLPDAWYNLGNVLKDTESDEAAVEAYRMATKLEPSFAQAYNNLGNVLRKLDRHDEAVACFHRSLSHRPGHVETWQNLGAACVSGNDLDGAAEAYAAALALDSTDRRTHLSQGEVEFMREEYVSAEAAFRRAVELDPESAVGYSSLGKTLVKLYRAADAERACREAIRLDAGLADAYANLGAALKFQHRIHEAVDAYETAIRLDPDFPEAHNNLGLAYIDEGEFDKARSSYEKALAVNPEMPEVLVNLAHFKRYTDADRAEIARLEDLLAQADLKDETRSAVHFALGKAYDECANHDAAFDHFRRGNELRARVRHFNRERHGIAVDKLIETFSEELLGAMAGCGDASELPVFIVGMPRSGTTLAEQIIASHPRVHGADELINITEISKALSHEVGSALPYPECAAALDGATIRRLAARYLSFLRGLSASAVRITDKMPSNFLHLGLIAILLPGARVVHCRRDPRDVCLSNYFQLFGQGQHFSYRLGDLAFYYAQYQRLMAHWRRVLPIAMHEMRYESLVADQESESRRLVEYCGLAWDERCLDFHRTRRTVQTASHWQVRQPMYRSSTERWKHYERHLPEEVRALVRGEPGA